MTSVSPAGSKCASANESAASSARDFAVAAFKRGDFESAQVAFADVAARAGDDSVERASALANRAQCLLNLGRAVDARDTAAEAVRLDTGLVKAWFRLGRSEARLRRFAEAQSALEKAAELRPKDHDIEVALVDTRRRRVECAGRFAWSDVFGRFLETHGTKPLGIEAFVGPVRVGMTKDRGRGLFLTADVRRGELLLCAEALCVAEGGAMAHELSSIVEKNVALRQQVLALSQGTPTSEQVLPERSSDDLAAPSTWAFVSDGSPPWGNRPPPPEHIEQLQEVLRFNQHALASINPNAAPVQITPNRLHSALFLLPSFLNHSCRPNVQRLVAYDRFLLRAGHDLLAGEELLDTYVEVLQPLAQRKEALEKYGFRCRCERCVLEEMTMDGAAVAKTLELGVKAREAGQQAVSTNGVKRVETDALEEAVNRAEALVGDALEACLKRRAGVAGGCVGSSVEEAGMAVIDKALTALPPMVSPVPAARAAQLRWGFETFRDAEEEAMFRAQDRLHVLLLGSMAGLIKQHALALKGDAPRNADQAGAWERLMIVLDEVLPCSDVRAATSAELLYVRLLSRQLSPHTCAAELRTSVLAHHEAFGGGGAVWHVLNKQMFTAETCKVLQDAWPKIQSELHLPDDTYDPQKFKPRPREEAPARASIGFEERLRRQARAQKLAASAGSNSAPIPNRAADDVDPCSHSTPVSASGAQPVSSGDVRLAAVENARVTTVPSQATASSAPSGQQPQAAARISSGTATGEVPVTAAESTTPAGVDAAVMDTQETADYDVEDLGTEIVVRAKIPGVQSAAQADLEVSDRELRLWCGDLVTSTGSSPKSLVVPLPRDVNPDSASAKWSKRTGQLTVRLRCCE
eukprot:TRINITY_DN23958_c0_g2_i1.p1 TRINITY_DN23958_c0_g2~~TRINITY_DN23958_c0_g2_i1.p1  ORF type:complete len:864 (-),score=168.21 TRINITY_DN23958_c0_g2_i1:214-2805(-)